MSWWRGFRWAWVIATVAWLGLVGHRMIAHWPTEGVFVWDPARALVQVPVAADRVWSHALTMIGAAIVPPVSVAIISWVLIRAWQRIRYMAFVDVRFTRKEILLVVASLIIGATGVWLWKGLGSFEQCMVDEIRGMPPGTGYSLVRALCEKRYGKRQ